MPDYRTRFQSLKTVALPIVYMAGLAGCSMPGAVAQEPVPEALVSDRDLPRHEWAVEIHPAPGAYGTPGYDQGLTLAEAINRALDFNPAVKAAFQEIEARHGEEAQSAVKPNPELNIDIENIGRNDGTETTVSLAQTIELGDKRLMRLQAAHLDASLAGWDYESVRVQVATQTARAFVDVIVAQDRLKMLEEFTAIANKTQASVDARVKAGKSSPIELDRAIVVTARAKAQVTGEKAKVEAAKRRLSVFWGSSTIDFGRANGRLGKSKNVPTLQGLQAMLDETPALARWSDEVGRRIAQRDVEISKSIPDLKIGAGLRHFEDNESIAAVASISIPLPVYDTNNGNIVAAGQRIAKAEHAREAARNDLLGALAEAAGELDVAAAQMTAAETQILPPAQSAFERTTIGYNEGKFDILNVLDAQRSVFEARLDLLNARADYEKARVKIEAIVGRAIGQR